MKFGKWKLLKMMLLGLGMLIIPIPFIRNKLIDIFLFDRAVQAKMEEMEQDKGGKHGTILKERTRETPRENQSHTSRP